MYHVFKQYSVDEIIDLIKNGDKTAELSGFNVKINSHRLKNFAVNGIKCATCNKTGDHFNLERPIKSLSEAPHLNLYTKDAVMLTADHDVLKSEGGKNHVDNYNVLCAMCNKERGNKFKRFKDFYDFKVNRNIPDGYVSNSQKVKLKRKQYQEQHDRHVIQYYRNRKNEMHDMQVLDFYQFLKNEKKMFNKYKNCVVLESTKNISKFDGSTSVINSVLLEGGIKLNSVSRVNDSTGRFIFPVKIIAVENDELISRLAAWNQNEFEELKIKEVLDLIEELWINAPKEKSYVF